MQNKRICDVIEHRIRRFALKRTFQPSPLVRPADYSSRNWAGTTKSLAWHRTTPPSADGWRNSEMGGYSTGSRVAADLAQPAPLSPSDRWSGPSVRSSAVLLGGAPDHQGRYPARVVTAGWRHSSYRCCIASLAPGALPWQGHQPEGRGSVGAALARPESARLLPLVLSQRSGL